MCVTYDLQLNLCYKEQHEDTTTSTPSHSSSSNNNNSSSSTNNNNNSVEEVWKETQQLMEDCEQLVRIMTHVCSQQFSGAYRTLARYSQGCWRGCSAEKNSLEGRHGPPHHASPSPSSFPHPSCSAAASSSYQQMSTSCEGCAAAGGSSSCYPNCQTTTHHPPHHLKHHHHHEESTITTTTTTCSSCRWRGGWGRRWRWRWGRWQCAHCHRGCSCCSTATTTTSTMMDSGGCVGPPSSSSSSPPSPASAKTTTTVITPTNHQYPPCPSTHATSLTTTPTPIRAHTTSQKPPQATAAAASPKSRSGVPSHPSVLTILLLLVVTLARFTDGCSSRSTPKPRPASPTMRPNITFQTYACPPAYAAWYCLNGATCFTVKIGESILYNCECADGYMGQRCEFKDLDGSYLPAREKVLLETASIAGGATVACVLVFIVLFAVYIFMQKDKDKRCRDVDDGRDNDRQPFSGYQNPRPEMFRTISNPYARNVDELSHVEVQSAGHGNTGSGRNGSGGTGGGGGSTVDSNVHGAQQPS